VSSPAGTVTAPAGGLEGPDNSDVLPQTGVGGEDATEDATAARPDPTKEPGPRRSETKRTAGRSR
jgi:hypothetical protein